MKVLWIGVAVCQCLLPCTVAWDDLRTGSLVVGNTRSAWSSQVSAGLEHPEGSRRTTKFVGYGDAVTMAPGYFDDVRSSSQCPNAVLRVQIQEGSEPRTSCHESANEGITSPDHRIFDEDVIQLRHFAFFMPLTGHPLTPIAIDSTAAAALALHHFNNGDGTVIPELAQLSASCPVRYTMEVFDTKFEGIPTTTAKHLQQDINPRFKSSHNLFDSQATKPVPSMIVGSFRGEVTSILSLLGGVHHIPTLTYGSAGEALDNREIYPTLARTMTSSAVDGTVLADYFAHVLKVKYVAVLYTLQADGIGIARAFQEAAENYGIKVISSAIKPDSHSREEIEDALRPLAESQFKYFFGGFFHSQIRLIMPVALDMGLAGPDTFWLFGAMGSLPAVPLKGNEAFVEAMNNTASLGFAPTMTLLADTKAEGCDQNPHTTNSISRFRALAWVWNNSLSDATFFSHFRGLLPEDLQQGLLSNPAGFPFVPIPLELGVLVYDAVMTLLFASCHAAGEGNVVFNTTTLYDSLFEVDFDGTYGRVLLDRERASRSRGTLPYTLTNYRATLDVATGEVEFEDVFTHMYTSCGESSDEGEEFGWYKIVGAPDFRYADGSTTQPEQLSPAEAETIVLETFALCFGYAMSGMVIVVSLALIAWVVRNRRSRVITLSQPLFLIMLCVGTTLMGSAIIPFGFQEPMSQRALDRACMAAPWLFCIGFVTAFSALLSRLSRVNTLFHTSYANRRRARGRRESGANVRLILLPFFVLLSLNLVVLLVWTLEAPLEYKVLPLDVEDEFGRSIQFYGTCYPPRLTEEPLTLSFMLLLVGINALSLIGANVEAYRARILNEIFSDSRLVGESTTFILQASSVGIPIPFLSVLARYIVVSCLVPAICAAALGPLFSYKIALLRKVVDDGSSQPSSAHTSSRDTLLSIGWTPRLNNHQQFGGSTVTMNTTIAPEEEFA